MHVVIRVAIIVVISVTIAVARQLINVVIIVAMRIYLKDPPAAVVIGIRVVAIT